MKHFINSTIIFNITDLPSDIISEIFSYLPCFCVLKCRQVSTSWKNISSNTYIWTNIFTNYFGGTIKPVLKWDEALYKEYYLLSVAYKPYDLLMWSISFHCISLARKLLTEKSALTNNRSFLEFMTNNGSCEIIKLLMIDDTLGNYTSVLSNHSNLLEHATNNGLFEIVQLLIPYGTPKIYMSCLYTACEKGYLDIVKVFIKCKIDISNKPKKYTPLHIACIYGHINIVEYLLSIGANLNISDDNGQSPLYFACSHGHLEIVELLISRGAIVNTKYDALYIACFNNHVPVVKALISHSKRMNIVYDDDKPSLIMSCRRGYTDIVKILLDTSKCESYISTCMYTAAMYNNYEIVKILIEHEINVFGKNTIDDVMFNDSTTLYMSVQMNCYKTVAVLLDHGAKVNKYVTGHFMDNKIEHNDTYQPLDMACINDNMNMMKLLIAYGGEFSCSKSFKYWFEKCSLSTLNIMRAAFPYAAEWDEVW